MRRYAPLLMLLLVLLSAAPVYADDDCASLNPVVASGCQLEATQYEFLATIAGTIWQILVRWLLSGAYWMDALRNTLTTSMFTAAYGQVTEQVLPAVRSVALLALMLGALALIALPITGKSGPINIRNVLLLAMMGPILLTTSGPLMLEFERLRVDIGTRFMQSMTTGNLSFGAGPANDMPPPVRLYPSNECNGMALERFAAGDTPLVDEQVAALVWASAQDIHCGERPLPMRFYQDAGDGPNYLRYGGIQNLNATDRQAAIQGAQAAINRLLLAVLPAAVAFAVALLHLVFACCTMMLWCSAPLGLLFGFFQKDNGWIATLIQRAASILKTSWLISIILGVLTALLNSAATTGDASRYSILTAVMGLFVVKFSFTALGLLGEALRTMTAVSGLDSLAGPSLGRLAGSAVGAAAGAATGGLSTLGGMVAVGASAMQQTGSGRYAVGAALGRFKPMMQLGTVAQQMGVLNAEAGAGLYAGHRMAKTGITPQALRQMESDANRLDTRGQAEERQIARQMQRAEQGNWVQQSVRDGQRILAGGRILRDAARTEAETGAITNQALVKPFERFIRATAIAPTTVTRSDMRAGVRRVSSAVMRRGKQAVLPASRHRMAMQLQHGRLTYQPRLTPHKIPATAERDAGSSTLRWLRQGHMVQKNRDGTITHWASSVPPARMTGLERLRRFARRPDPPSERPAMVAPRPVRASSQPHAATLRAHQRADRQERLQRTRQLLPRRVVLSPTPMTPGRPPQPPMRMRRYG